MSFSETGNRDQMLEVIGFKRTNQVQSDGETSGNNEREMETGFR